MIKTVSFVGGDVAPTNCFNHVEHALHAQYPSLKILNINGGGKPINIEMSGLRTLVPHSDLVVLGLSSSLIRAESEIVAANIARDAKVPYGYYSDMALCPFRPWVQDVAKDASLIMGLLPSDTSGLTKMYPSADIYNTGNPFRGSMAFPKISREEVREKLKVKPSEQLIIAPGNKFAAGNFQMWGLILETLRNSEFGHTAVVMCAPHPGDSALRAIDNVSRKELHMYEEMLAETSVRTLWGEMSTSDAIAGADLVIDFTGDACVRACYLRVPLINIATELQLKRFEKETVSRTIETIENGAGYHLEKFSEDYLVHALRKLLDSSSEEARSLHLAQETAYPIPEDPQASLNGIVAAIATKLRL